MKWRRPDLFGSSIVNQTLSELKNDADYQNTQKRINQVGLEGISKEERIQRRRALNNLNVQPFAKFLSQQPGQNSIVNSMIMNLPRWRSPLLQIGKNLLAIATT